MPCAGSRSCRVRCAWTSVTWPNLVIGDRSGRIAWRLSGARPDRGPGCAPAGFNAASNQDCAPWPIRSDAAPALIDPPSHRLWTANGRVLDGEALASVGHGGALRRARPAGDPARRPRSVPATLVGTAARRHRTQ
ncbi:hypothetical protein G6F57_020518 [Rhizopus arrhizus]|nr:hypothetical protein G6F57_020518 [Rhizopus arrhizus]